MNHRIYIRNCRVFATMLHNMSWVLCILVGVHLGPPSILVFVQMERSYYGYSLAKTLSFWDTLLDGKVSLWMLIWRSQTLLVQTYCGSIQWSILLWFGLDFVWCQYTEWLCFSSLDFMRLSFSMVLVLSCIVIQYWNSLNCNMASSKNALF